MKKIGIIFAMDEELRELKEYIKITKSYNIFDLKFYEGTINNNICILVESGVGKVNAARCTQILIDKLETDYIFNIGVAGGISDNLTVGDVILGEKLVQHDFDITAFNHEKGYIPNTGVYINSNDYLLNLSEEVLSKNNIKYWEVLPINECNNHPYSPISYYALEEDYISLDKLFKQGLIKEHKIRPNQDRAIYDNFKEQYGLGDEVTADTLWKEVRPIVDAKTKEQREEQEKLAAQSSAEPADGEDNSTASSDAPEETPAAEKAE